MATPLPRAADPHPGTPTPGWNPVFLATGFRPFFLLAALHALISVPLWLLALRGGATPPLPPALWHAHEMVYGFAVAVIAGFLLTAVRHWTDGRPTASGAALAALAALWTAGRVALFPGIGLALGLGVAINLLFLPALALAVGRPILAARSQRNYKVLAILTALWCGQALLLAGSIGAWDIALERASGVAHTTLLVVVLLCLVIAGRIVPLFTGNAIQRKGLRPWPAADAIAFTCVVTLIALGFLGVDHPAVSLVAACGGGAVFARMRWWGSAHTLAHPLLWILHLGHAWIGVGLLLSAAAALSVAGAAPAATHALAFGGVGTLILGMMARVTLGHTGRALVPPRLTTLAFIAFQVGALLRVMAPLLVPHHYLRTLDVAGALWALAFLLYLVAQGPMLLTPRPDGRPG